MATKNPKPMHGMKAGDTIWHFNGWGTLLRARITGFDHDKDYVLLKGILKDKESMPGSWGCRQDECFPTKEAALLASKDEYRKAVAGYEQKITDVEQLVRILYNEVYYTEDGNTELCEAVRTRAKQLMGIELEG